MKNSSFVKWKRKNAEFFDQVLHLLFMIIALSMLSLCLSPGRITFIVLLFAIYTYGVIGYIHKCSSKPWFRKVTGFIEN